MEAAKKIPLVVVAGPTASGKTAAAIHLCQKFDGEVVSADSMQIYRGMDIGTGKDIAEQLADVELFDELLLPAATLRAEGDLFLCGMTPDELSAKLGV